MNALGIVVIALAILISVIIHEGGHFFTAKLFGMKATKFFVGFGPTLFSRRRGETEYGVKAVPAGGFVTIIGMTPLEEVAPEDESRAFFRQSTPKRVTVLAAGSATHLIIAVLLATGVAFLTPIAKPGVVIGAVSPCVPVTESADASPSTNLVNGACPAGQVASPAAAIGLRAGDVVTAVGGKKVTSTDDPEDELTKLIRTSSAAATTITVTRKSPTTHETHTATLPITLAAVKRDLATGAAGNQNAFALGVSFSSAAPGYVSPSLSQGGHTEKQYLGVNNQSVIFGAFYAIGGLGHSASQLFNHSRSSDSGAQITSVVGVAEIGGDVFADNQVPFSVRLGTILTIIAAVNASLGILNLLPLLPFDGGHIAVTLAERLFRRKRSLDVGARIKDYYLKIAPVMYVFSFVIIAFSLVVVVADIGNPVA